MPATSRLSELMFWELMFWIDKHGPRVEAQGTRVRAEVLHESVNGRWPGTEGALLTAKLHLENEPPAGGAAKRAAYVE